ncbi:glycerophosphodiester phosphodiesterase [soil metagenome]
MTWLLAIALAACSAAPKRLDYEGHRGARGLRPENTVGAFDRAIDLGVDTLEMDVMLTADDVLVVHHDEHLNPDITRDETGAWLAATGPALRTLTFAELRRYDVGRTKPGTAYAARFPDQVGADGVRVPTLREVIEDAEQRSHRAIHYNIEIKTTPAKPADTAPPEHVADALVAVIREQGIAQRATIQSFDWRGLHRVKMIAPELPTSCLTEPTSVTPAWNDGLSGSSVPALVATFGCQIWSPDQATLTAAEVARAHRLRLRVLPWTVNAANDMARLVDWGVDGLISDLPDRLPHR